MVRRVRAKRARDDDDDGDRDWPGSSRPSKRIHLASGAGTNPTIRRSLRIMRKAAIASLHKEPVTIIDLTDDPDEENQEKVVMPSEQSFSTVLQEYKEECAHIRGKVLSERPECQYINELTNEELQVTRELMTGSHDLEQLVAIENPSGGKITLQRKDFKRLRGSRWLDDELINAYMALINTRSNEIVAQLPKESRKEIPRTYAFNTFFFTCLTRHNYDYAGVARWTKRAKLKVLDYDLLLIPVNLGNTHWVLSGIDISRKCFLYLDSMHGNDYNSVVKALKKWLVDEVRDKYSEERATSLDVERWSVVCNQYQIRRVGVLPKSIEPRSAPKNRWIIVPRQGDSGSCGVFTAKAADCLSLGIKMYYMQSDMSVIRSRMALELFGGFLTC